MGSKARRNVLVLNCDSVKLPGIQSILDHDGDGTVFVRWRGDQESDYTVQRPYPLLCLLLITRLGYRVKPNPNHDPDAAA